MTDESILSTEATTTSTEIDPRYRLRKGRSEAPPKFRPYAEDGERLKAARRDADLTQAGLAHVMGCSRASVTAWETGLSAPVPITRELIAATLGVKASEIWIAVPARNERERDILAMVEARRALGPVRPSTDEDEVA